MAKQKRYEPHAKKWEAKKNYNFKTRTRGIYRHTQYLNLYKNGDLYICKGYTWNGSSPKWVVLGLILGCPDGAIVNGKSSTYEGTMLHDAGYQLGLGKRNDWDLDMYDKFVEDGFPLARLWLWAVKIGGKDAFGT